MSSNDILAIFETQRSKLNTKLKSANGVKQFEDLLSHAIGRVEKIFTGEIPVIVQWEPNTADSELIDHYQALRIPTLHGKPCLLLHELGEAQGTPLNRHNSAQLEEWKDREERIHSLFRGPRDAKLHSIFLNTSGSGKTRLVLEGLCSEWGLYFTCKTRTDEIGSSDIMSIISQTGYMAKQGLKDNIQVLPRDITILHDCPEANKLSQELRHNITIATRCFHAAMVARLLVFSCFLVAARRIENLYNQPRKVLLQTLRKTWLLVQLDTRLLGVDKDLLERLTCILCTIRNPFDLVDAGSELIDACKEAVHMLDPGALIYCVVDEAQAAVEAWPKAFRDHGTGRHCRPALRAMMSPWVEVYKLKTIVTGTSINHKFIMEALSSTIAKESDIENGVTSTGSWADERTIKSYLNKYLPQTYLATPSGVELIERASYWLWGRPRFISAYVQLVVQNGFQGYHRLLSQCVKAISNFVPLDGEYWERQEPTITLDIPRLCPFDYERVSSIKYALMDSVQSMAYERLMSGNLDFTATLKVTNYKLVECGFARFPGSRIEDGNPLIDEPLAYLAADIWLNSQQEMWKPRHDYFAEQIGKHSPISNGLERYTALLLAEAFRDFTQLSRVFDFANIGIDRGLAEQRARLVSCWHDSSNTLRVAPSRYPIKTEFQSNGDIMLGPSSPSHLLGYKAPKPKDDKNRYKEYDGNLEWLAGRVKAPFLFPMEQLGPDIMLRLQLERTGEIIIVALQVKHRATSVDFSAKGDIKKALRTVTPQFFWKDVNGKVKGPQDLLQRTFDALAKFPGRFNSDEAGYGSVLRGIFVFPGESNRTTCDRIMDVAVKLTNDTSPEGLPDLHDVGVIPTNSLMKLGRPIHDGLKIIMMKAKQQSEGRKRRTGSPGTSYDGSMRKADIVPQLKLSALEELMPDELALQLFLHRQLEANRHRGSGPIEYLTEDPKYLNDAQRLEALQKAVARHVEVEERIRARRRD